jgi:hypothetical protein
MSPELGTLDQLLDGDLPLTAILSRHHDLTHMCLALDHSYWQA